MITHILLIFRSIKEFPRSIKITVSKSTLKNVSFSTNFVLRFKCYLSHTFLNLMFKKFWKRLIYTHILNWQFIVQKRRVLVVLNRPVNRSPFQRRLNWRYIVRPIKLRLKLEHSHKSQFIKRMCVNLCGTINFIELQENVLNLTHINYFPAIDFKMWNNIVENT